MAYVEPSGIIQLMKGINLDNRYAHTIYFENESLQNTYFSSKVTHTFDRQSYTRHNSDIIRIKVASDAVADCTYMRFQNKNNGKWYYAFINYVDYINENVTAITFEIDVMQTWFFQTGHDIKPCFVDREHVSTDTFGIYHAPDTPKTDEYVYKWLKDSDLLQSYTVCVSISSEPTQFSEYDNNAYNGCRTLRYLETAENASTITEQIKELLGGSWDKNVQSANMIDMYSFPTAFASDTIANNVHDVENIAMPTSFQYSEASYTPKNKRLLSNPYSMLLVTDYCGENSLYEWEMFGNPTSVKFTLRGNPIGGGSLIAYPRNYAGLDNNFDSGILLNNFPKRAFSYDAYSAWLAAGGQTRLREQQTLVNMQGMARSMETVGDMFAVTKSASDAVLATEAGIATGGVLAPMAVGQAAKSGQTIAQASANTINRQVAQREAQNNINYAFKDAKYAPDVTFGKMSSDIGVSHRIMEINFIAMFPKYDEAIRIDDFFSTYGYSIKEVKQPNLTGRKHWNFLKTKGAVIGGNMPTSSRKAIADIFDGGIFLWKNGDEVGNFRVEVTNGSINNPIV